MKQRGIKFTARKFTAAAMVALAVVSSFAFWLGLQTQSVPETLRDSATPHRVEATPIPAPIQPSENGNDREAAGPVAGNPVAPETDLNSIFPPSELPEVATANGARASLGCLAGNGADLSRPMPSKHRVFAANEQVAARLAEWAKANGFEVRGPVVYREHTGTPRQRLDLVRTEVPVPEEIERQGRLILDAVLKIPGTYYQTWSGEIVR